MTLAEAIEDKKRTLKYLTGCLDIKTDSLVLEYMQEIKRLEELLEYRIKFCMREKS